MPERMRTVEEARLQAAHMMAKIGIKGNEGGRLERGFSIKSIRRKREEEAKSLREWLAERDAAYAAWERENGVRPRITESRGIVTVCRGHCCAGRCAVRYIDQV